MRYYRTQFSFDIEKMFDYCKLKSLYAASSMLDNQGNTQEKSHAITDNERDFFDITLKDAASNIYDTVSQDTKIVDDPFQYNVSGNIILGLMVHGDWDVNQSFGVHTYLESAICDYIIKEWFKIRNVISYQAFEANYQTHIQGAKNLLNRRITPASKVYRYL